MYSMGKILLCNFMKGRYVFMKVKELMCNEICTCTPDTTIADCAKLMSGSHVGCVPVCNQNNEILGIVTDRDLILRCVACDKDPKTTKVNDVMTSNICCCTPTDEVENVESKMNKLHVRRIPVVEGKKVIGMVTLADLVTKPNINKEGVYVTIENICKNSTENAE